MAVAGAVHGIKSRQSAQVSTIETPMKTSTVPQSQSNDEEAAGPSIKTIGVGKYDPHQIGKF